MFLLTEYWQYTNFKLLKEHYGEEECEKLRKKHAEEDPEAWERYLIFEKLMDEDEAQKQE